MILVLAGTTEAKEIVRQLERQKVELFVSVVHANGAKYYYDEFSSQKVKTRSGALNEKEMVRFIKENRINLVIDATHPFAEEATQNAYKSSQAAKVLYLRYERPGVDGLQALYSYSNFHAVDYENCVSKMEELASYYLQKKEKVSALFTTGSNKLEKLILPLSKMDNLEMVVRVLPRVDSVAECERLNIAQKNIIAMQGPFTPEMNKAIYNKYSIDILVTKESGNEGSTKEKVESALQSKMDVVMIMRPKNTLLPDSSTYRDISLLVERACREITSGDILETNI